MTRLAETAGQRGARLTTKRNCGSFLPKELLMIYSGSPYLFYSTATSYGHAFSGRLMQIITKTELKGKTTSHGFRYLASTTLNEEGFDSNLIEKALAHKDDKTVRAIYNKAEYVEKRWKMLQWWGDLIES